MGNRPESERQARPLARIKDPAERRAAWEEAVEEMETIASGRDRRSYPTNVCP